MSETPLVLRSDSDGICTLTLNRPDNPIGMLVITGAGEHFCAGHGGGKKS